MDSKTQLPTFTLAIYVGVLAGLVVFAVAFTMLRVYSYRHRLSTVTICASFDADAERADTNNSALIATTLSALGSPLPDFPDDLPVSGKTSMLSSFDFSRWAHVKSFVASFRDRGLIAWASLHRRLATRRASKPTSKPGDRVSQTEVEITTPCNSHSKSPATPNASSQYASKLSSKFQLSLFQSPMSDDIGMI